MSDVAITISPTIGKLAAALAKAQLEMGAVVKDARNPHFKNTYASLAACIEATKLLNRHGFAVVQPPAMAGPDGVSVETFLLHESGEWIRGALYMPASKKDAQGFGSALSYARRYCLCATANLATDDDDGEAARKSGNGDMTEALQKSVEWGEWEKSRAAALKAAKTKGELLEVWNEVNDRGRESPNGTLKRLAAVKDECKAALA
jgi:hypothetical protein